MPTLVVAQKAETFAENRGLVVPHPERGAQRVGQDEDRRVLRSFEDVVQFHYGFLGHLISPSRYSFRARSTNSPADPR